jgi:hypothetical protein
LGVAAFSSYRKNYMEGMFLKNRARWVAAARHHFAAWERKERYIFAHMTPGVSLEGVTSAGGYYRIGRHFPIERRHRLVALIEEVASPEGSSHQRFDGFVRSVRTLANLTAEEFGTDRRRVRPLSGLSKLLWYRFPFDGFIYDSQVLAAFCKNGLVVRFDTSIASFGGRPSDPHEWNFMIAAAAYRAFVLPLHRPVAEIFESHGLEPQRSARLLDMLFWLEGDTGSPATGAAPESGDSLAEAVGEEAFERCGTALSDLLGGE